MLHLQLLGPLIVIDDEGADLTPPGARERNALVTLALVAPDPLSTERLAAELYSERPTADPRNAVQAVISRLRRALGRSAGAIETTTNGYRFVDVVLDVDDADRLLQAAIVEETASSAQELLDDARGLWQGDTLLGVEGPLIDGERVRLDARRADAEDAVAQRWLAAGANPALIATLEAAVLAQPLREKRWEQLMLALYRDGRQADALRAFQRARARLLDDLGLEPGSGLARLEQQILAHDPTLDAPSSNAPSSSTPSSSTPSSSTPSSNAGSSSAASFEHVARGNTAAGGASSPPLPGGELPSGTVSILLCDVEGSVRRWEAEPTQTRHDIEILHEIWSEATVRGGGSVVKSTGDGLMAAFATAEAAIGTAAEAMKRQASTNLVVKTAINTGAVEPIEGDYRGPVVNRCARLMDVCNGGQILISGTTAELARPDLPQPLTLRELGLHRLRDVPDPIRVWQVDGPGIRSNFPPIGSAVSTSLPRLRTDLLGRDELIEAVVERVGADKLVTLLGPGGIGKTSIAVASAWVVSSTRPVTFVDLARVTEPAAVAQRIVDELGTSDQNEDRPPSDQIADRLRANTDLVVIDNAEHVLGAVADVIDPVLGHDLKGSFLVTSRQPLGTQGEGIVGVPPLGVPGDADDLEITGRSPSVQLFCQRVRTAGAEFEISAGLLPVVAHICRRLDGIPLAIELAAGRASMLSVDDIAARLDDQLRLLRQLRSSRERRHRSLEAVVGWSLDQLTPSARRVFQALSVMAGSFGLAGVEAVLGHLDIDTSDILEDLDELCGASLLVVEAGGSRFAMLEPIRQVGAGELADLGLGETVRRAHARWMIDLVSEAHSRRDDSRAEALAAVDLEADQLLAAVGWIGEVGAVDLAVEISLPSSWWFLTRDAKAGERLLGRLVGLVDRETDPLAWAAVIMGFGVTTAAHPRSELVESSLEAVAILDEYQHPDAGFGRVIAAFAQTASTDPTLPLRLLDESERLISSDDRWASAIVDMAIMTMSGLVYALAPERVDRTDAITRGERAASTFRSMGEVWALGVTVGELGRIHQSVGDLNSAEACYAESLELMAASDFHGSHYILTELGRLASAKGQHTLADQYHREAIEIAEVDGNPGCCAMAIAGLAHAAEARDDIAQAIETYQRAIEIIDRESLIEHGQHEWRAALDRLLAR